MAFTSNKKLGNQTEQMYLNLIKENGGWASLIPPTELGQPVDSVSVINGIVLFADIKNVMGERFSLTSIPENQIMAMELITRSKNESLYIRVGFAIYFRKFKQWGWLSYSHLQRLRKDGIKSVKTSDIQSLFKE